MGKRRLQQIAENFAPNEINLNPHSDQGIVLQKKEQTRQAKMNHARTVVYRRFKKIYRSYIAEQRKHLVLKVFGYWKYWLLEGKIGPDDDKSYE